MNLVLNMGPNRIAVCHRLSKTPDENDRLLEGRASAEYSSVSCSVARTANKPSEWPSSSQRKPSAWQACGDPTCIPQAVTSTVFLKKVIFNIAQL